MLHRSLFGLGEDAEPSFLGAANHGACTPLLHDTYLGVDFGVGSNGVAVRG